MRMKTKSSVLSFSEVSLNSTKTNKKHFYVWEIADLKTQNSLKDSSKRLSLLLQMTEEIQSIKSDVTLLLPQDCCWDWAPPSSSSAPPVRPRSWPAYGVCPPSYWPAALLPHLPPPHPPDIPLLSTNTKKLNYWRGSINDDFRTHPCISEVCTDCTLYSVQ